MCVRSCSSAKQAVVGLGYHGAQDPAVCGVLADNQLCTLHTYRHAVAAALPQLQTLDGQELAAERTATATPGGSKGATALQHLAAMQLQAFSQARSLAARRTRSLVPRQFPTLLVLLVHDRPVHSLMQQR